MSTTSRRLLLRGGTIHSPSAASATALLAIDGQVAWVGDDGSAGTYADSPDLVVELEGRLVTPGFVDAHTHLAPTGFALESLDLSSCASGADGLSRLQRHAADRSQAVLFAYGWDETRWPEGRPFTGAELDGAVGDRVAYVSRVDSHSAVVSTGLLAHDPSIRTLDGWHGDGLVERDAHHAARSVMHGLWTPADRERALRTALAQAAGQGITSVHELNAPHIAPYSDFETLRRIARDSAVPAVVPYWGAFRGGGADDETLAGFAGDLCVDGAIGSHTACLHEPYADEETTGHLYLDREQVAEHLVYCTQRGVQAGFHVIGDRAMAEAVAGLEAAASRLGDGALRRSRHRLEHAEMPAPEHIATLARLSVVASVQPSFDAHWGGSDGLYERRLGRERARPMNPFASLHRAGVVLAFGSDSPITRLDPWGAVLAAVFHSNEAERLSVATAFDAHTRGGHRARGDDESGVLRPGAAATYAVWDLDEEVTSRRRHDSTGKRHTLPDLHPEVALPRCVQTVVDGMTIFTTDALPHLEERG